MSDELQKIANAAKKSATELMGTVIEGLTAQSNMKLMNVSDASADLLRYVADREQEDPLVNRAKNEWEQRQPNNGANQ